MNSVSILGCKYGIIGNAGRHCTLPVTDPDEHVQHTACILIYETAEIIWLGVYYSFWYRLLNGHGRD